MARTTGSLKGECAITHSRCHSGSFHHATPRTPPTSVSRAPPQISSGTRQEWERDASFIGSARSWHRRRDRFRSVALHLPDGIDLFLLLGCQRQTTESDAGLARDVVIVVGKQG